MNEIRFVTIFAVSIAGWIVIMWLTLSAVTAAQQSDGGPSGASPDPAAVFDAPARPSTDAAHDGDGVAPGATPNGAHAPVRAGGAA